MQPVTRLLRFEGAILFVLGVVLYVHVGASGWLFILLFLVPDVSMVGYLHRATTGAICYNAGHTYVASVALATLGYLLGSPLALAIGLIWTAHIGFDRMLGYGLKSTEGFHRTHLGVIGSRKKRVAEPLHGKPGT